MRIEEVSGRKFCVAEYRRTPAAMPLYYFLKGTEGENMYQMPAEVRPL